MNTTSKETCLATTQKLFANAASIRYGQVSATLRVHDGRIVDITHCVTETLREQIKSTPHDVLMDKAGKMTTGP